MRQCFDKSTNPSCISATLMTPLKSSTRNLIVTVFFMTINFLHSWLIFTVSKEADGKSAFIGVVDEKAYAKIFTFVYRKPTFSKQIRWNSFRAFLEP